MAGLRIPQRPTHGPRNAFEHWWYFPRDAFYAYRSRLACRLVGRHNACCAGRPDHPRRY